MSRIPPVPAEDLELALRAGLRFEVATKPGRGMRWDVVGDPCDLNEAFAMACALVDHEVAIFKDGMFYWTTKYPDVCNSIVLTLLTDSGAK